MKFSMEKCRIMHVGMSNSRHQYMLETKQLESSFAERDLVILMES